MLKQKFTVLVTCAALAASVALAHAAAPVAPPAAGANAPAGVPGGPGGRGGGRGGRGGAGGAPAQLGPVAMIPDAVKQSNPPRTPNPCATYTRSGVRNDQRHNAFVEIAKKGDIDILFEGDSITDWWQQAGPLATAFTQPAAAPAAAPPAPPADGAAGGPPGGGRGGRGGRGGPGGGAQGGAEEFKKFFGDAKVANFAVAGDTTQGVLWGMKNGECEGPDEKIKPKAIMLMIGTNNMGGSTPGEIAEGIGAIVAENRKDFPDAKILLLAIFPRGAGPTEPLRAKITECNDIIKKLDDGQHVFYMDLGPKFLDKDGKLIGFRGDNLHPNPVGYEIWGNAVADKLKSWTK
jgi:lysophospholipase L1-like esterase